MIVVHHTAIVDPSAELGPDVVVGPFAIVGPGSVVGAGTEIAARALVDARTRVGRDCYLGVGSIVGGAPQDLKYRGEPTSVEIGDGTRIREYTTVNRGTAASGRTIVGRHCFLMSYVHVAHDCVIEDGVVLANTVQLGGHVHVAGHAAIGGSSAVHQFVRIGTHAFVGGGSRVPQDVPPYARAAGNPLRLYGTNAVGLRRAGFAPQVRLALQHAFRLLFNSDLTTTEALDHLREARDQPEEVRHLLDFVASTERGVLL